MQVNRFVAADMRRALELVRQELGADAIILSSRRVKEGVELVTTLVNETSSPAAITPVTAANNDEPSAVPMSENMTSSAATKSGPEIARAIELATRRREAERLAVDSANEYLQDNQVVNAGIRVSRTAAQDSQTAAERYGLKPLAPRPAPVEKTASQTTDISQLQEELAEMRILLEEQLTRLGSEPPGGSRKVTGTLARRLVRMGFDEGIAGALTTREKTLAKAWPLALERLARQLPVHATDIVAQGGVHALVGPTGAGKTTTIAKLAARYVMAKGADKVALVTTDTSSVAGREALKGIGAILRVPVRVVDENNPLDHVLRSLRRCELILIDTAGMRPGDPALKPQLRTLARLRKVYTHLVLPANSQMQMLKASLHAYALAGLKSCILTKLDETQSLGEALSVVMRARLPIAYTTDGQDVPRNIAVPQAANLLTRAQRLVARREKTHQA